MVVGGGVVGGSGGQPWAARARARPVPWNHGIKKCGGSAEVVGDGDRPPLLPHQRRRQRRRAASPVPLFKACCIACSNRPCVLPFWFSLLCERKASSPTSSIFFALSHTPAHREVGQKSTLVVIVTAAHLAPPRRPPACPPNTLCAAERRKARRPSRSAAPVSRIPTTNTTHFPPSRRSGGQERTTPELRAEAHTEREREWA